MRIGLMKAKSYAFPKNEVTSLDKLHVHPAQQGFHLGLRLVGVALSVANERERLEMSEGLQLRGEGLGQVNA